MVFDELRVVEDVESKEISIEKLVEIWRTNHRIVLDHFMSINLPYFGLHGAPKASVEGILSDSAAHLNMGTFYDKEKSEFRVFQLYALCSYVSNYCREPNRSHETEGGILVFDLEGEDGENITERWEHLYSSGLGFVALDYDTEEDQKMLRNLHFLNPQLSNNTLWRTDVGFHGGTFERRFKGFFKRSNLKRTESDFNGRTVMLYRLDDQYNLAKTFDIIRQEWIL